MKKLMVIFNIVLVLMLGCNNQEKTEQKPENITDVMSKEPHVVKVMDIIPTNDYTYLDVKEGEKSFWIAVPKMQIEKGEMLYFSQSMEMKDFKSPTLNRTFESVLFVQDARKSSDPNQMQQAHSNSQNLPKEDIKVEPVEPGKTISNIYANKVELNGKTVKIKGKVVKYNPNIMKRNWIHIQDGSGSKNDYDLVITSQDAVKIGDVITVEGILNIDKDFGAGYFFPVIIENAKVLKGI